MTRVMICGAMTRDDIGLLAEAGADAVGLITEVWQDIPCNLSRGQAKELSRAAPPFVSTVLIVTEESVDEICRMAEHVAPDAVQLHGFNSPEDVATIGERLDIKVIKTLHFQGERMAEGDDPLACARQFTAAGAHAILVDSYGRAKVGATGQAMSLATARSIREALEPMPLILAGGLHAGNVAGAIDSVRPFAVDVFSGVTRDGALHRDSVEQFISAVRLVNGGHHATG